MNSTGIVMQIEKRYAFIMTNSGEFLKIKIGKQLPNVGQVYTGQVAKETPFFKYASAAASLLLVLLSGTASYAYYTPTASVVVDINPSIELKVNRWDRILKTVPLNSDGEKVLSSLDIKNKALSDGLDMIVEEAKKDNFINDSYIKSGKIITVSVKDNKLDKEPDLSGFEDHTKKSNLKVKIIKNKDEKPTPNNTPENSNKENKDNLDKSNNGSDKQQNNNEEKSNNGNGNDNKTNVPANNGNSSKDNDNINEGKNTDNKNNGNPLSNFIISSIQKGKAAFKSNNNVKSNNRDNNSKQKK
jgi:hypothetical protein